jgi:hypothetical protein
MAITINEQSLLQFSKLLIELGGIYELQDDMTIKNTHTDEIVSVVLGKKPIPIVLFKTGLTAGEYAFLNPYKESQGKSKEREWFFGMLECCVGVLTKKLMHTIISDCVAKKDDNYSQFPLMTKIMDKTDATMLDEIDKIPPHSFISIYYNKADKKAEAQTEIFSEELRAAYPKFRKKTWEVIGILFREFFGTEDLFEDYVYTAKIMSIPETDAKLHVIIALVKAIGPLTRDVRGCDLHENELQEHLDILEGYSELYAWVNVSNATSSKLPTVAPFAQMSSTPTSSMMSCIPVTAQPNQTNPFTPGIVHYPATPYGFGAGAGVPQSNFMNCVPVTATNNQFATSPLNIFHGWPR